MTLSWVTASQSSSLILTCSGNLRPVVAIARFVLLRMGYRAYDVFYAASAFLQPKTWRRAKQSIVGQGVRLFLLPRKSLATRDYPFSLLRAGSLFLDGLAIKNFQNQNFSMGVYTKNFRAHLITCTAPVAGRRQVTKICGPLFSEKRRTDTSSFFSIILRDDLRKGTRRHAFSSGLCAQAPKWMTLNNF